MRHVAESSCVQLRIDELLRGRTRCEVFLLEVVRVDLGYFHPTFESEQPHEFDGDVVTRDQLFAQCWGENMVGNESLNRVMARIRQIPSEVTPGFFETLSIPIVRGRSFTDQDDATAPSVAVIGSSLADRLWPGQDPIGRQLTAMNVTRTVIGVARNIAVRTIENASDAQIYFPAEQLGRVSTYYAPKDLLIRAANNPTALAPAIRAIVRDADAAQAVSDIRLLDEIVATQTAPRRDQLAVLGGFAAIAFLLAAIGIHGLLSFTVSSRLQEVGVRVALGAARGGILRMFLNQGLALGLAGVAIAAPLAYLAARTMKALLFGVEPGDPLIYGAAAALAVVMTLAGSLRPAIRAATIDPALSIRSNE